MTDPALGPRTLFLGGTIAGGFATLAALLAILLGGSLATVVLGGSLPIVTMFAAAYDYGDRESVDAAAHPNASAETEEVRQ